MVPPLTCLLSVLGGGQAISPTIPVPPLPSPPAGSLADGPLSECLNLSLWRAPAPSSPFLSRPFDLYLPTLIF